jgi:oligoribonuclease NrnB/cAMP/cGMP phosphodiesterase (DHH superfamily)
MSSRQKPKPYVIYHADCADGISAAYAAYKHFEDEARYIACFHDNTVPELAQGADIYMVDFTFKKPTMLRLAENHKIVVIDHHLSSQEDLVDLPSNIEVNFDMNHSAATLAWKYFQGQSPMPRLFEYVEDRDIWKKELPDSDEVALATYSYPKDFDTWFNLTRRPIEELVAEGKTLLRAQKNQIASLIEDPRGATIHGHYVPVANAPYFLASDIGHYLLEKYPDAPFAGSYRDNGKGERHWSIRSENSRLSVKDIAVAMGGGGHRNAAGFMQHSWVLNTVVFSFNVGYEGGLKNPTLRTYHV